MKTEQIKKTNRGRHHITLRPAAIIGVKKLSELIESPQASIIADIITRTLRGELVFKSGKNYMESINELDIGF